MKINQALDIKNALITLGKALGMKPEKVVSKLCFLSIENRETLIQASDLWNEFNDADITERGAMLGITVIPVTDEATIKELLEDETDVNANNTKRT